MLNFYRILKHFNTNPEEYTVIFTSGCTGALKLVAESFNFHGYHCSCCHGNSVHDGKQETSNGNDSAENNDLYRTSGQRKGSVTVENLSHLSNFDGTTSSKRGSFVYFLDNHTSVQGMREIVFTRTGQVSCVDCDKDAVISDEHVVYKHNNFVTGGNCLFAYPAQSNFSGQKYPMEWISKAQNGKLDGLTLAGGDEGRCYVLLDAACLVGTSTLDLGCYKPDFVTLSFYKMFGYPTGLGKFTKS